MAENRERGFSLLELVIVVIIICIVAAIAIPRMSQGVGHAVDTTLRQDLGILRRAIDHYAAEHDGRFPSLDQIEQQLLLYTDRAGNVSATQQPPFVYGPYLRAIPAVSVGPNSGSSSFTDALDKSGAGWVYDETTGEVHINHPGNSSYSTY